MFVRLGLKMSIDWKKYNMQVIADVPDGKAAWEAYIFHRPDIVITDLKMPFIDGMKLISRIRETDSITKIIILTCLEEFDLVKKAIALGVSNYILKLTMSDKEMESVLEKVGNQLAQEMKQSKRELPAITKSDMDKKGILRDLLLHGYHSGTDITTEAAEFKLRLSSIRLIACIMEIDNYNYFKSRFNGEDEQIRRSVLNVLDELLGNYAKGEATYENSRRYILIFSFENTTSEMKIREELLAIIETLQKTFSMYFNTSVSFGISGIKNGYSSLGKLCEDAAKALERKFFKGLGLFFIVDSFDEGEILRIKTEKMISLTDKVSKIDGTLANEYISKVVSLFESANEKKEYFQKELSKLMLWTTLALNLDNDDACAILLSHRETLYECDTIDGLIEIYEDFLDKVTDLIRCNQIVSPQVSSAICYIKAHLAEKLTLQQVAEYVNINANYFSILFKKEMKINFVDYLTGLRLEKAKKLLTGTCLKSYEIALEVGFNNDAYFNRTFKKMLGLCPSEYRKKAGINKYGVMQ